MNLKAAALLERLQDLHQHTANELDRLSMFPDDDPFEDGDVLWFEKRFTRPEYRPSSKVYTYAAIRCEGLWYSTGPKAPKGYAWNDFVVFLGEGVEQVWVGNEWTEAF